MTPCPGQHSPRPGTAPLDWLWLAPADEVDDGRPCLAFDASTAFRIRDGMRLAGSRDPPDALTLQTWVVRTAGRAGCCPSQRPPMPGTQKPWPGRPRLKGEMIGDEWGAPAQATD